MVKRRFAFVPFFLAAMFRPFLLSMAILSHTRGIPPSGLRIAPTCALSHSYAMGSRSTGDAGGQDDLATPDSGRARRDGNDWDGTRSRRNQAIPNVPSRSSSRSALAAATTLLGAISPTSYRNGQGN